jgi:hypothetical protein
MNKTAVVEQIMAALREKAALHHDAARAAHAEATHEESMAEDKYDTRGLEASYLAAGQARQMAEVAAAIQEYAGLFLKKFSGKDPIDLSALVTLTSRGKEQVYFIGPGAGGLEVDVAGTGVLVITPSSPIGQKLIGRSAGSSFSMKIGPFTDAYKILAVA